MLSIPQDKEFTMKRNNPAQTDGFDFLEFSTNNPETLIQQFESLGFSAFAKHRDQNVIIYQQNDIRFFINTTKNSHAQQFADQHGPCVTAMGFRVADASFAHQYAIQNGA